MAKELFKKEEKLGEYGAASVTVDSMAVVTAKVEVKVDLIAEVKRLAAQTKTPVDDQAIAYIEGLVKAANAVATA